MLNAKSCAFCGWKFSARRWWHDNETMLGGYAEKRNRVFHKLDTA
jgi:hypothetical protein